MVIEAMKRQHELELEEARLMDEKMEMLAKYEETKQVRGPWARCST